MGLIRDPAHTLPSACDRPGPGSPLRCFFLPIAGAIACSTALQPDPIRPRQTSQELRRGSLELVAPVRNPVASGDLKASVNCIRRRFVEQAQQCRCHRDVGVVLRCRAVRRQCAVADLQAHPDFPLEVFATRRRPNRLYLIEPTFEFGADGIYLALYPPWPSQPQSGIAAQIVEPSGHAGGPQSHRRRCKQIDVALFTAPQSAIDKDETRG